jgi:hypothetical protein
MKLSFNIVGSAILLTMCATAVAAPHLTPRQCSGYPFKQPTGEVTQHQLQRELSELEAIGYYPRANDIHYPGDLQRAETKLDVEYQRDCMPAGQAANLAG